MTGNAAAAPAGIAPARVLAASGRLSGAYDVALLDLDGVVYVGADPVPGAAAALAEVRKCGMRLAYVTNNASRRPTAVASMLSGMGVPAAAADVVTSAQAAARLLAERLPPGSPVLVVGSPALADEVRSVGLEPVDTAEPLPAAVVQGYGPDTNWRDLAEATVAVRGGALWVATNTDITLPSARGPLPGNGALVAVVALATGARPEVVGKPHPGLHRESVERTGARRPLVVGDRLDTDVEGAVAAGADSLLVFTGVTTPAELLAAPAGQRPTYLSQDLNGLRQAHPQVAHGPGGTSCGGFRSRVEQGRLVLDGAGSDPLDALRALCAAGWAAGLPAGPVRSQGAPAQAALTALGIEIAAAADRRAVPPVPAGTVKRGQPKPTRGADS